MIILSAAPLYALSAAPPVAPPAAPHLGTGARQLGWGESVVSQLTKDGLATASEAQPGGPTDVLTHQMRETDATTEAPCPRVSEGPRGGSEDPDIMPN